MADRKYSRERVERANLRVGDEVVFNFNDKTGEIIYLQNTTLWLENNRCARSYAYQSCGGASGEMAELFLSSDPYELFLDGM